MSPPHSPPGPTPQPARTNHPPTTRGRPWPTLRALFGANAVPPDVADLIRAALDQLERTGDIGPRNRWQALEWWAADQLATPQPPDPEATGQH